MTESADKGMRFDPDRARDSEVYGFDGLLNAWLDLPPSDWQAAWNGERGEAMRALLALAPWQRPDPALGRERLELAIRRLHANSDDAAAQLVLRSYGRDYERLGPDWLAPWLEALPDRCLRVLPPVKALRPTILIPTYNRIAKLERVVASIFAQTDPDWNLLIVDDGSTDETEAYCRRLLASDARLRYLRKPVNSGLADSFDLLCRSAETELILSIADDDCLMPGCLAALVGLFQAYPWIAMAGGGYYQLHIKQGQLMAKQFGPYYAHPQIADPRLELQRCGIVNPLFGSGQLLRRSALAQVSRLDPGLGQRDYAGWDWLSTAQLLSQFEVAYSPEIVTAYLDQADGSNTFSQDWGANLMRLLELLIADYTALYGPGSYPEPIARYFLEVVAEPALVQGFHRVLNRHQQAAELDAYLAAQRAVWEDHRRLRTEVMPGLTQACLVDEYNTSGLSHGEIPGLAQGSASVQVQQLIRAMLQHLRQAGSGQGR